MDDKKEPKKLKDYIPKDFPKGLLKKDRLVILLLVGVLLAVIALPTTNSRKEETDKNKDNLFSGTPANNTDTQGSNAYTQYLETHLEEALTKVEGVGNVKAMVTLKASSEKIMGKDRETSNETTQEEDSQGGTRNSANSTSHETTVYQGGDSQAGGQSPYVTKELSPVIEGVVIIAEGGGNAVVVENITGAVKALFDIDTHKIRVMKLNHN